MSKEKAVFLVTGEEATPYEMNIKDLAIQNAIIGFPMGLKRRETIDGVDSAMSIMVGPAQAPCWFFSHNEKKHVVIIPDQFNFDKQTKENKEIIKRLNAHSIMHEFGHALYTDIDIEKVALMLKKENVPFDVLNIFEDMRIENLVSKFYLDGQTLNTYADVPKNLFTKSVQPDDTFFQVLVKVLGAQGDVEPDAFGNPYYLEIKKYREKSLLLKNTYETALLSIEFYKKYKHLLEDPLSKKQANVDAQSKPEKGQRQKGSSSQATGYEDLEDLLDDESFSEGNEIVEGEELKNEIADAKEKAAINADLGPMSEEEKSQLISKCKEIKVATINQNKSEKKEILTDHKTIPKKEHDSSIPKESNTEKNIDLKCTEIPEVSPSFYQEAKDIYKELCNLLVPKKISKGNYDDGDINVENMISLGTKTDIQSPLFKKEKLLGRKTASLHILYDASGSMYGTPDENGKKILFALNEMAKNSLIDVKLTVSKVLGTSSRYQTVELPINYKAIFSIIADGDGEGLAAALQNGIKENALKEDLILFFTDGNLTGYDQRELKRLFDKNSVLQNKSIGIYLDEPRRYNKKLFTELFSTNIIADKSALNTAVKICELAKNPTSFTAKRKAVLSEQKMKNLRP